MARPPAPAPTRPPGATRPRASAGSAPRRRRRRWLPSWKAVLGTLLLLALGVVGLGAFAYASIGIPAPDEAALAATTTVYYADGKTVLGQLNSDVHREPLTPTQMPEVIKQAAVASEDRSFYTNKGVSVSGLARAVKGVLTGSDLGGGSTITQQYVKNFTQNGDAHTYTRKAREAVIALKVDRKYSKDEILTDYLNTIYFGRGANGVAAAAKAYFGLDDASQLTLPQAALLVGIIPSPSAWDPRKDPAEAQKRYSYVLDGMVAMTYTSRTQADQVATMPPTVEPQASTSKAYAGPNGYLLQRAQEETMRLGLRVRGADGRTEVLDSADAVRTAGLRITTTVDQRLQDAAVTSVADPKVFPAALQSVPVPKAALAVAGPGAPTTGAVKAGLVSIDPATGGVVALYGGADYLRDSFNAVTQAGVQAGSTFKPFTLIAALQKGIPLTRTYSGRSPQTFPYYTDASRHPVPVRNFANEQLGQINLIKATADSVNTVYVPLNHDVGPQATAEVAKSLGVTTSVGTNAANVLGTDTVHPLDMAGAYAALAAGGVHRTPHLVAAVDRSVDGHLYQADTRGTEVLDPGVTANAVYAMQAVVKSGTASSAGRALGKRPAAGKTGTVQDNNAAWFNGFTPQLETAVVLYYPNPLHTADGTVTDPKDPRYPAVLSLPRSGGKEITGGTVPTAIWTAYMTKALKGADVLQFPRPSAAVSTASATPTPTATATESATATPTDGATDGPTDTSSSSARTRTPAPTQTPTDGGDGASGGGDGGATGGGGDGGPTGIGPTLGVGLGGNG